MLATFEKIPQGRIEVLLTDGSTRASLAVARSLARKGISFAVLCPQAQSLAYYSRYVKYAVPSPDPGLRPDAFVRLVLELIRKHDIRLIIPITDQELAILDRHRRQFEPDTKLAMASSEAIEGVLDKRKNLELARRLGVPCPREFRLKHLGQIPEMIQALGFPMVLKRARAAAEPGVPQFGFKFLYAHDEAELRYYVDQYCLNGQDPLFQECAQGEVRDLCCFAVQGEVLAIHEYLAIRRFNGSAVLRRIVEPSPDLVEHSRNLLAALKWDGVAHVSFYVGQDGQKWYMETNGRFWASTEGSVQAGWDFPDWTCEYFLNGKKPEPGPVKLGSQTCWHTGDLLALLKFVAGQGEIPTPGTTPGRLRAALQFISGFGPGIHSDIFRWHDPLPAFAELWPYCSRVFGLIRGHARSYSEALQIMFPADPSSADPIGSGKSGEQRPASQKKKTGTPLNAGAGER